MFKSWWDIEEKFEVFSFMCGILEDPSPAVDHLCEQYAACIYFQGAYHLIKITNEIRNKKKFLNLFCNDHIYFVWKLPLQQQSRYYLFDGNLDWLKIGSNASTTYLTPKTGIKICDCGVIIKNPCLSPHEVLQAISTLRQTISFLYINQPFIMRDEACDNIPDHVFKIDPSATQIIIEHNVVLPKAICKDFGRELATCYNLSKLSIPHQPLVAAEIIDFIGTNRYLKHLDMDYCNLSEYKMWKLCQQFGSFSNLEYCLLSGNTIGDAISVLAEAIKSWGVNDSLNTLKLRHCNIPPDGCSRLLQALTVCPNLVDLDLSHNTIAGAFDGLVSKPMYPRLQTLVFAGTSLTSEDIQTIDSLIKGNKMPKLDFLHLSYIDLDKLALGELETLESLQSILQNVQHVFFWKGDELLDLKTIEKDITTGILKHKSDNKMKS